jgi:hypothetical protein
MFHIYLTVILIGLLAGLSLLAYQQDESVWTFLFTFSMILYLCMQVVRHEVGASPAFGPVIMLFLIISSIGYFYDRIQMSI